MPVSELEIVEPAHHKEDAWTFTYSLDDYYTLVEENEHSCSITFVKKPSCWLRYPAEPYECTDDCRLRIPCRDGTVERVHIQEYEYDIEREVDENGEDEEYDETQEDYYRESLDRRRKRHSYST